MADTHCAIAAAESGLTPDPLTLRGLAALNYAPIMAPPVLIVTSPLPAFSPAIIGFSWHSYGSGLGALLWGPSTADSRTIF